MARAVIAESLGGSAVVRHSTWVSDSGGGGSFTWTAAGTFACRVAPVNSSGGNEAVVAERLTPESQYIFTFAASTPITHKDQIIYEGGTFAVTAVRTRSDEVSRRVEAKQTE